MPSVMQRIGTPNARHNIDNEYRKFLDNVDPSLSQYNEVISRRSVDEIYAEKLQPAFDEFNERQKRKDRRLDFKWNCSDALGYQRALDKAARGSSNVIDQKGRPPIREIVWQIGNPEQGFGCRNQTGETRELAKTMLLEVQAEAERRYPQIEWGDVIFHADEVSKDAEGRDCGSFHLHAAFVPLCYENKQGMSVQVAFERCLSEMGFSSFQSWKHDLDQIMEEVLERHNLERTFMDNHEQHQSSHEFHRQQDLIRETKDLEKQRDDLQMDVDIAKDVADKYQELAAVYEQEAAEASNSALEAKGDLEDLQGQKKALEGQIAALEAKKKEGEKVLALLKTEVREKMDRYQDEKEELQRTLPVVRKQVKEAKEELQVVQKAVDQKMDQGQQLFSMLTLQERLDAARKEIEKEKKMSRLEALAEKFERFLQAVPGVRELWNRFIEKDRVQEQKKSRSDWER